MEYPPQESNVDKKTFPLSRKILGVFFGIGIGLLLFLIIGSQFLKGIEKSTFDVLLILSVIIGGLIGWKSYSSATISYYAPFLKVGFLSSFLLFLSIIIPVYKGGWNYLIVGVLVGVISFFLIRHRLYDTWNKNGYFRSRLDRTNDETNLLSKNENRAGLGATIGIIASSLIAVIYGKSALLYFVSPIVFLFSAIAIFLMLGLIMMVRVRLIEHSK